ncbi:hypothetical protein CQ393_17450 [Stenotrophomonas sp. MYb238]|nr:hypothetical protein [Stenotrophomonas sp. MYb238]
MPFFHHRLVSLFPTFAVIAHYIVGTQRSGADLQKTALFGLWSLFPYAGYLVAVYAGSVRWPLAMTLGVATAVWVLMALGMIVLWGRLHPSAAGAWAHGRRGRHETPGGVCAAVRARAVRRVRGGDDSGMDDRRRALATGRRRRHLSHCGRERRFRARQLPCRHRVDGGSNHRPPGGGAGRGRVRRTVERILGLRRGRGCGRCAAGWRHPGGAGQAHLFRRAPHLHRAAGRAGRVPLRGLRRAVTSARDGARFRSD